MDTASPKTATIKKSAVLTYPRTSGKCAVHRIPDMKPNKHSGLKYLLKNNVQLVKGDLIIFLTEAGYRNDGVMIYDGVKIIDLGDEPDDYGTLPKCFTPIEDGAPLNYWHNTSSAEKEDYESGDVSSDSIKDVITVE